MALLGRGHRGPPPPLFVSACLGVPAWAIWHYGGPLPLVYLLGGLAIVLAILDLMILAGTGGQRQ